MGKSWNRLSRAVTVWDSENQFWDTVKSLWKFSGKGIEADPREVWTITLIILSWGFWKQRWSSISMLASWQVRAGWSLFIWMYFWDELESKSLWVLLKNDILKKASWLLGFRITTEPKQASYFLTSMSLWGPDYPRWYANAQGWSTVSCQVFMGRGQRKINHSCPLCKCMAGMKKTELFKPDNVCEERQ